MNLYEKLKEYKIEYVKVEHEAVYTCEQAERTEKLIDGICCKNLFLKSSKKEYFIYILPYSKRADLKKISKDKGLGRLSFAGEDELADILRLIKGCVTPFGIINDTENKVSLLIDKELEHKKLLFHPNINTATVCVSFEDLLKFIEKEKHKAIIIN